MNAKLRGFGELELEGKVYDYDVVIDAGKVRKRAKKASKPFRDEYGHTPLSVHEELPWGGKTLLVGTGAYGRLPVMPEVAAEARRRGVKLVAVPTEEACRQLGELERKQVYAVMHITC